MAKKRLFAFVLVVCFLFIVSTLCGCYGSKNTIHLSGRTQREIINAFVDAHSNDQHPVTKHEISLRCYGEFDGVYVLFVDVASYGYTAAEHTEVIAGVKFIYPDGRSMIVYSNGEFYTIAEAYENGTLSYDNLLATQQRYKVDEPLYEEESNGNENDNSAQNYKLTVQDPDGYLIEDLRDEYQAGKEVVVKTTVLSDGDLVAYLDGVCLGLETQVYESGAYHWEFYFDMPAHDAILSFALSDGLTKHGIALDEDIQWEIKTAVLDVYIKGQEPITQDDISLRCYGAFDGVYVLFVKGVFGATQAVRIDIISGVKFVYSTGLSMLVYSDGAFYEIYEAYANNILTYDDMLTTQQNYKACTISLYRECSELLPSNVYE